MSWAYVVVGPQGQTVGPLGAGLSYTYLISDEMYAQAYDDLKNKYESPLVTTDGVSMHRVWLYRYDTDDTDKIYPIVWQTLDGSAQSLPNASTVLESSVNVAGGSAEPNTSPANGGLPVSSGGPVTITNIGTRQMVAEDHLVEKATVAGIGTAGVLLGAAAGAAFLWLLVSSLRGDK